MKKTIALILTALMALSLFSCGGAMPETPTETPVATPETAEPVESEPITPDNTKLAEEIYQIISEIEKGQMYMRSTNRTDWITAAQFDQIDEGMLCSDAITVLGQPHFIYPGSFGPRYVYVADDGSVYELFVDAPIMYKVQKQPIRMVLHIPSNEYVAHIENNTLESHPIVSGSPDETIAQIHGEVMSCLYMYQNERTDYPTMEDAKKIYVDMSANEVEEILGKPHYIQIQEERPTPNSGPMHERFYVLSNGVLMAICCPPIENAEGVGVTLFNVDELDKFPEYYLKFKAEA